MLKHELAAKCLISGTGNVHGEVWTVAQGPNSKARRLASPPRGHRVTVALPCVLGSLGMSSRFGTPQVDSWKKIITE